MAALNAIARAEANTIREGIAWLIVWKTGRSWHAESVYLNIDDTFEQDDLEMVHKILDGIRPCSSSQLRRQQPRPQRITTTK